MVFSCINNEMDVILRLATGNTLRHWLMCLEINEINTVTLKKYKSGKWTWYMPKINGQTVKQ